MFSLPMNVTVECVTTLRFAGIGRSAGKIKENPYAHVIAKRHWLKRVDTVVSVISMIRKQDGDWYVLRQPSKRKE